MGQKFCKFVLTKVLGWKIGDPVVPEKKCIILGVPHTSIWDFPISYFYYRSVGGKARIMIKKEFFWWPLGALLRSLGAIPTDRTNPTSLVRSLIEEMDKCDSFHLCIAPEGTRKPVHKWKTGYHFIATQCNVPVYMGYFDWGTKTVGRGEKVELTGNAREDTDRIQALYKAKAYTPKHPERFVTE